MKKYLKRIFAVCLSLMIVMTAVSTVSDAASKHMIIINSKKNTLNYYVNCTLVREFRCATGKSSTPTPQLKTTIVNKIVNRPYYKEGIPGGHPDNPLGKRWMGLKVGRTYGSTYGIHGTNNESSIGKNVSGGCIRMHNADVEWLFDQVTIGTVVIIRSTSNSDNWIANRYNIQLKGYWYTKDGERYYRKATGYLAKGWYTVGGKTYYFDKTTGAMQTGFVTVDGITYYLGTDGARRTGWQIIDGEKYYFKKTGEMIKGRFATMSEQKYYFQSNGQAIRGRFATIDGERYYFNSEGKMLTGWQTIGGERYYFKKTGIMIHSRFATMSEKKYYFDSEGRMLRNSWVTVDGKKYYVKDTGVMVTGEYTIDGETYTFDEYGVLVETEIEEPVVEEEITE